MQFNFGENWKSYSLNALNNERVINARSSFDRLFGGINLNNKNFLDIGCGQGLSSLIAAEYGANVVANDINPVSEELLHYNKIEFFPDINIDNIVIGSVLDDNTIEKLRSINNKYDIIHSWGVIHHTGNMKKALIHIANLLNNSGYLVLSVYNKHWSSKFWLKVKFLYNVSPNIIKKVIPAEVPTGCNEYVFIKK